MGRLDGEEEKEEGRAAGRVREGVEGVRLDSFFRHDRIPFLLQYYQLNYPCSSQVRLACNTAEFESIKLGR
jgi:hypothetical protein